MENSNLDIFSPAVPVRLPTKNITKEQLLNFKPFTAWAETLKASLALQQTKGHSFHDSPYTLRSVDIQSVDWFGPTNLGF
jgi:ADP-sugar diphosphatase